MISSTSQERGLLSGVYQTGTNCLLVLVKDIKRSDLFYTASDSKQHDCSSVRYTNKHPDTLLLNSLLGCINLLSLSRTHRQVRHINTCLKTGNFKPWLSCDTIALE